MKTRRKGWMIAGGAMWFVGVAISGYCAVIGITSWTFFVPFMAGITTACGTMLLVAEL